MAVKTGPLWIAVAGMTLFGLAAPLFLARGEDTPVAGDREIAGPLSLERPGAFGALYSRTLFAAAGDDALPADAPDLIGIVGRLGDGAVALVRLADGSSRTIGIGESVDGWRLDALAIDAASFTRGGRQIRVAIATDDVSRAEEPPQ
ncbi:hypothetical protein [Sphingosinithalassobacter portus]|uniref:hypothetical protein n=1 Tax=Stakelama portus TaxID=2676234 RepID=UPI000D6DFD98|nr:hypothetical protein [Sphingosinithalassobacter portus]